MSANRPRRSVLYMPASNAKAIEKARSLPCDAVILDLNYVDNNRPDFRGDPRKIPSIRGILIDHVTIEGSEHAGRIVGLPDSRITDVTLRDVTVTAEHDFVIKHAEAPTFQRVTRTIRPGVAPARESYLE